MRPLTARLRPAPAVRLLLATLLLTGSGTVLATSPAQAASSYRVVMSGYAFGPRALTITAGSNVTWVNQDQAPHDVETTSGPESVHSPLLNKGGTWSHTFTTPGTYGYVCTVHPGMTAQLIVKPATAPTPTSPPATHEHSGSTPTATRSAPAPTPTAHTSHSHSAAAPPAGTPSTSPTAAAAVAPPIPQAASATRPLDPLLLLAGVVAGVAVLCLLLVGSRSASADTRGGGTAASG
ncbi:cupredoxin domain-containing protein [Streptomyces roseochromogenus]|uniref:Blue (type 1) copper domain-containing protein n=1 Tax=Streptomyces roseochromogenus subsp. oscitans DS 12.976 TaxID=1352936 RepID=V6KCC7_STRRC|nr:plastocyanin/azurin family copper-binding protein [Streptomyces roseochromogenus]EST29678.1 hypothetical protein M878_20320 [Streptomyces roseochromogenus subsp. oscitans DS 12.976]